MNIIKLFKNAPITCIFYIFANIFIMLSMIFIVMIYSQMLFPDENSKSDYFISNYWWIVVLLVYIIKFSLFPTLNLLIEKFSKHEGLKVIVKDIRNNQDTQYKTLKISLIIDLIICSIFTLIVYSNHSIIEILSSFVFILIIYLITGAGLFGSYLALFNGEN